MRTFTIEQVRGWLVWWLGSGVLWPADVDDPANGVAAWCDRQAKDESTLPPRPSDEWVAAQRWEGKRVELTGECAHPTGRLYVQIYDSGAPATIDAGIGCPSVFDGNRWILRTIEPAAPPTPAPKVPPQAKTCATCDFHRFGQCRKNSPNAAAATLWPKVSPTDGCGKWKAAAR